MTGSAWKWLYREEVASFSASFVLHALAMAALMLLTLRPSALPPAVQLFSSGQKPDGLDWVAEQTLAPPTPAAQPEPSLPASPGLPDVPSPAGLAAVQAPALPLAQQVDRWMAHSAQLEWDLPRDVRQGGSLDGRTGEMRRSLGQARGGTPESEAAVERGLRWLVAHQCDDGAWRLDLKKTLCNGQCRDPGTRVSTTAATGLALLAFLGAGYTHKTGEYAVNVERGLTYLATRRRYSPDMLDLQEGREGMYGQGLATMALCEAYAMTGDRRFGELAQRAVNFIVAAQDPQGGGWRYDPGQPGDTTVTGWQLMALKSAQMARFNVPLQTFYRAGRFLDGVASDGGAQYGYMTPHARNATTAIGLLCRMYLGWGRDNPALARGVALLAQWGPSEDNLYYNYYAAQVMNHFEGPAWYTWNMRLRSFLIKTQGAQGHEAGSWHFHGGHGDEGGRLYNTAMAVMTLEVYYRYLPLYGRQSVE